MASKDPIPLFAKSSDKYVPPPTGGVNFRIGRDPKTHAPAFYVDSFNPLGVVTGSQQICRWDASGFVEINPARLQALGLGYLLNMTEREGEL